MHTMRKAEKGHDDAGAFHGRNGSLDGSVLSDIIMAIASGRQCHD